MKLLFALRKENFKKVLPGAIVCILLGVLTFFLLGAYELPRLFEPRTLAQIDPQNMFGVYIDDEIPFIYGYFNQECYIDGEGNELTTGRYYTIDLNDGYYISLLVHGKQFEQAVQLEEASLLHWDDSNPAAIEGWPALHVKGSLVPMREEVIHSYYEMDNGDPALKALMLPYTLDTELIGIYPVWSAWFALGISAILVGYALASLLFVATGRYEKKLCATIDAMIDRDLGLEKLNDFYYTTSEHYKIRINEEFMLFQQKKHSILLRPQDVVWVYPTTARRKFLFGFKTFKLELRTIEHEIYTLSYKKQEMDSVMDFMTRVLPRARFGHNQESTQSYYKNYERR